MHELSIVMGIFELVEEISEEQGLKKIKSVTVEAGELCAVIPEYLAECWNAAKIGSPLENTSLNIIKIPAVARCRCSAEYEMTKNSRVCPVCGKTDYEIIGGRDFTVKEIEGC